jgi:hypothetical protein
MGDSEVFGAICCISPVHDSRQTVLRKHTFTRQLRRITRQNSCHLTRAKLTFYDADRRGIGMMQRFNVMVTR